MRWGLFVLATEGIVEGQEMQLKHVWRMKNYGIGKRIFGLKLRGRICAIEGKIYEKPQQAVNLLRVGIALI